MIAHPDALTFEAGKPSWNDPTPEEILLRTAAIRSKWTESQRERRQVAASEGWLPPTISLAELAASSSGQEN